MEYTADRDGPVTIRANTLSAGETGSYTLEMETDGASPAPSDANPSSDGGAGPAAGFPALRAGAARAGRAGAGRRGDGRRLAPRRLHLPRPPRRAPGRPPGVRRLRRGAGRDGDPRGRRDGEPDAGRRRRWRHQRPRGVHRPERRRAAHPRQRARRGRDGPLHPRRGGRRPRRRGPRPARDGARGGSSRGGSARIRWYGTGGGRTDGDGWSRRLREPVLRLLAAVVPGGSARRARGSLVPRTVPSRRGGRIPFCPAAPRRG